jgi:hypothetical protein
MRLSNTHHSKFYIPVLLCLGLPLALGYSQGAQASQKHEQQPFTKASLDGEYAYFATGEGGFPPEGELGVYTFDGSGNGRCKEVTTVVQQFGGGSSHYSCEEVTYTVRSPNDPPDNPDDPQPPPQQNGIGTMTITKLDGSEVVLDFVITKAKRTSHRKIATEVFFIQQDRTELGNLVTGFFKQRSQTQENAKANLRFTNGSLFGNYAFTSVGRGGEMPQARSGIVNYDGNGVGYGFQILNLFDPDPPAAAGQRVIFRSDFKDTWEVEPDGTGTIFYDDSLYAAFVITKAEKKHGHLVATEISILNFEPCCFVDFGRVNNFTTYFVRRLPD